MRRRSRSVTVYIHHGKFEHYFRIFRRRVLPLVHGRGLVAELLREKSFDERKRFYEQKWDGCWRAMFSVFFSRFVMGRLGRDPEFFRYVEGSVADRIRERAEYAFTHMSTHGNPYLTPTHGSRNTAVPPVFRTPRRTTEVDRHRDHDDGAIAEAESLLRETSGETGDPFP